MLWYRKKKKFDGEMLWIYFLGYDQEEYWIEGLRTDQVKSSELHWQPPSCFLQH